MDQLRDTGSHEDLEEAGTQIFLSEHPEDPALLAS